MTRQVIAAMLAHARETAPHECCGLLVGTGAAIDEAVPVRNLEASPTRYRVDPAEHLALVKRLRGSGRDVVGAYHSHPHSSAVPSPADVAEAYYPDFVYVIVSLAAGEPQCRAWRISDGTATEMALAVAVA